MYRSIRRGLHKEGNSILENENDGAFGWNVRGYIKKTFFELLSERWDTTIYGYMFLKFWKET
jgi:hypothetical protein